MKNAWLLVHISRFRKWQTFYRFIKRRADKFKKNYRPISLLPICGKYLRRFYLLKFIIICVIMNYSLPINLDFVYNHLCNNELLSPNQSGFRPSDSTVNQQIAITHQIHLAFEKYHSRETRAVFLFFSKLLLKHGMTIFCTSLNPVEFWVHY